LRPKLATDSIVSAGLPVGFRTIDILEPDSLSSAFAGVDVVIHLAAAISVVGDPDGRVRRDNVDGARNVAKAALDSGVSRLVHCSSVHAFALEACGPSLDENGPRTVSGYAPLVFGVKTWI
jgi:dihydroflavonol-4-reductase